MHDSARRMPKPPPIALCSTTVRLNNPGDGKGAPSARGLDLIKQPSEVSAWPLRCLVSPCVKSCLLGPVLAFNEYLTNKMEDKAKREDAKPPLPGAAGAGDAVPLIGATPTSIDAGAVASAAEKAPIAQSV